MSPSREFFCRVPASLAKDAALSPEARLLYLVLCAHADEHTGRTFVGPATVERLMGCGCRVRRRAQRELVRAGWLRLERKPASHGRWGARIYVLSFFRSATKGQIGHGGENAPYIRLHSQVRLSSGNHDASCELQPSPQAMTD